MAFAFSLFSAEAKDVTPAQAKAIAAKYIKVDAGQKMRQYRAGIATESAAPDYYAINGAEGKGFVLVAGDDQVNPVLGYSTTGSFDYDNMPASLKAWLDAVSADIESIRKTGNVMLRTTDDANEDAPQVVVAPLVKTHWSQAQPYNGSTPTIGGVHALTGCPATALAQIMNYYQWPVTGTGSVKYDAPNYDQKTVEVDFSKSTYDWANMLNDYTMDGDTHNWTDAQGKAVAQLMSDIGAAVRMSYGVKASGAWEDDLPNALIKHFGYKSEIYRKTDYTTKEWMSLIKSQLDASNPLAFGGTDINRSAAHEFVVDGYDSHDYLHVNWGWNGSGDGYFTFAKFGSQSSNYNFSMSFVTLLPNKAGEHVEEQQTTTYATPHLKNGETDVNVIEGEKADFAAHVVFGIQHPSYRAFEGDVRFVLRDAEGHTVKTWGQQPFVTTTTTEVANLDANFTGETFDGIADGTYKLGLEVNGTRSDGTRFDQWVDVVESLMRASLVVANGKLTLKTTENNSAPLVVKSLKFNKSTIGFGEQLSWKLSLDTSTDEDFYGPVVLVLRDLNGGKSIRIDGANLSVFSGLTNEFSNEMLVSGAVDCHEGNFEAVVGYMRDGNTEFAQMPEEPVLLNIVYNPDLVVKPYFESRKLILKFADGGSKEYDVTGDEVIDIDMAQEVDNLDFYYSVKWETPKLQPIYTQTMFSLDAKCGDEDRAGVAREMKSGFEDLQFNFELDTWDEIFDEKNYGKIIDWQVTYLSPTMPKYLPVLDKDGNPALIKIRLYDSTTGIQNATVSSQQPKEYFDIQGNRLSSPVKGLNIIRMTDGSVKKVMMK